MWDPLHSCFNSILNIMRIWPLRGGGGEGKVTSCEKKKQKLEYNNYHCIPVLNIPWGICSCMLVSLYNLYCKIFSQLWLIFYSFGWKYIWCKKAHLPGSFFCDRIICITWQKKTCFFCQTVKNVHWINLILHVLCDISLKHKFVTPRSLHLCYLVTHPFLCTCQFFNFSALFKKIIRYWWHSGNWEEKLIRCIAMVAKLLDDNKTKIHHY